MPQYNPNILEEELKNQLRIDFFSDYDATPILGKVDFAVANKQTADFELFDREFFLWAESKKGTKEDILESFIQLIITIGKAKTHEQIVPPRLLGAFDAEKIAFLEFHHVVNIFYENDFNWNVTPSDHNTPEFKKLYTLLHDKLAENISLFSLSKDEKSLHQFIRKNFRYGQTKTKGIQITQNNCLFVFQRWVEEVKPSIQIDWDDIEPSRVVDFFFADLISRNDYTLRESLAVLLRGEYYKIVEDIKKSGALLFSEATFSDGKKAYRQFWNKFERPPRKKVIDLILLRHDLFMPQNLRQYQGAFFTPPQWVQKSQEYIADELGENWQEEYYVWDCCAGTGNLLYGLTEPHRVWASTLNMADVAVMHDRIKEKHLPLTPSHVFQFDFLNDSFEKLPDSLKKVISDAEKRKKLVVYINPPYAEAADKETVVGKGKNKTNVAVKHLTYQRYLDRIGIAGRELFAQFFMRIYDEMPSSVLAEFSKLKILQAPNFRHFREVFRAKLGRNFIVPADSFDNVKGNFPIGFFIWHLDEKETFEHTESDIYDHNGEYLGTKSLYALDGIKSINDWIITTRERQGEKNIGYMASFGSDFQHANYNYVINHKSQLPHPRGTWITNKNIIEIGIYYSVRHCVQATWLNDRDQFLYPLDTWKEDFEFQNDCLAYTLFNNNIQSKYGINHWIPFTEKEVGAKDEFDSHFMSDFLSGKIKAEKNKSEDSVELDLFGNAIKPEPQEGILFKEVTHLDIENVQANEDEKTPLQLMSAEAKAVMNAGRELWRYYHSQPYAKTNASFYDIRLYFQGTKTTPKGKEQMNATSDDAKYNELISSLRTALRKLAEKIEPKVYEHGFLRT